MEIFGIPIIIDFVPVPTPDELIEEVEAIEAGNTNFERLYAIENMLEDEYALVRGCTGKWEASS